MDLSPKFCLCAALAPSWGSYLIFIILDKPSNWQHRGKLLFDFRLTFLAGTDQNLASVGNHYGIDAGELARNGQTTLRAKDEERCTKYIAAGQVVDNHCHTGQLPWLTTSSGGDNVGIAFKISPFISFHVFFGFIMLFRFSRGGKNRRTKKKYVHQRADTYTNTHILRLFYTERRDESIVF